MRKKFNAAIYILIPLAVGALASLITSDNMSMYMSLNKPALSPPAFIFPIVWTLLYILMGISSYFVSTSDSIYKTNALTIYFVQLAFNFFWSIIFFGLKDYLFAFVWLLFLWGLIIAMIVNFYKVNKTAAYLQIPYLLWVTFAGYLNLALYLLNT